MKALILTFLLFFQLFNGFSQKNVEPTDQFVITGLVDKEKTITIADIKKEKVEEIGNLKITNHAGEFRREYKSMKGVSLLSLLKEVNIKSDSPRELSEFYFVFTASDGYKVVLSWNELFNSELGNSFYIVTEADGISVLEGNERILLVALKDFKTGRRHVKGLKTIEVKRD